MSRFGEIVFCEPLLFRRHVCLSNLKHALSRELLLTARETVFSHLKGVFTWENSHRRESHTGIIFLFRIAFTWWLGHFRSRYLKVHFMLMKYTCDSKSQTLRMRYPFQSTNRPISHRYEWSFLVYMRDTVARFRTRVKFLPRYNKQGELTPKWLARHDILCGIV